MPWGRLAQTSAGMEGQFEGEGIGSGLGTGDGMGLGTGDGMGLGTGDRMGIGSGAALQFAFQGQSHALSTGSKTRPEGQGICTLTAPHDIIYGLHWLEQGSA